MDQMMLVVLLAVGFALIFVIQAVKSKNRANAEDKVMKGYFLLGLSGLMAKIAMADGKVTGDETEMAEKFFKGMDLTPAERAMCIGNFITARRSDLEARDHAKRFMAYANAAASEFLYSLLWRLSSADGVLDPAEDKLLADIADYLGLGEAVYRKFKAGARPSFSQATLRAAGVPPSLLALA